VLPIEGSNFNLLTMDGVVVTQSGSETLSEAQLARIIDEDNTQYETIWGYAIAPSGSLYGEGAYAIGSNFTGSFTNDSTYLNGSSYVRPSSNNPYATNFLGVDLGTAKDTDYMYVGFSGFFMAASKAPYSEVNGGCIYKSSNNSSWSVVDSSYNMSSYWSYYSNSRSIPYTLTSSRYIGNLGEVGFQPNGTVHQNDRVGATPNVIFAYNTTASGIQGYEMKIDLGDVYDIFSVYIEDNADLHKLAYPYAVTYALEDTEYGYKNKKQILEHAFLWYEEDKEERSPVPSIYSNPNDIYKSIYMPQLLHNPNDNCLYLYYGLVMYKFDLNTRVWSTLATNSYATYNSEITLDTKSNEIYGVGNYFWKYIIGTNSFEPLAPPPSSLTSGTITNICYVPTNHSLYCGVSTTGTFFRYDIKTDTWTQKTSITSGKYFMRGGRTLYSPYDDSIYAVPSSSSSSTSLYGLYKYSVTGNTWSDKTVDNMGNTNTLVTSFGGMQALDFFLDSKRNVIHFIWNYNYDGYITYHIEKNSWIGYPSSSSMGFSLLPGGGTSYRDYANNDYRVNLTGLTSYCYVASEDRAYSHGENYTQYISGSTQSIENNWVKHLRYSSKLERLYSTEHLILSKARYIKIKPNSSKLGYPLMIKKLKVRPINTYYNSTAAFNIVETGVYSTEDPIQLDLVNNTNVVVYSGSAYFSNNLDGYFELSDTIDGVYTGGVLDFTFPLGLAPASGYSLFVRHNFPEDVQRPISTVDLNVLLEGLENA